MSFSVIQVPGVAGNIVKVDTHIEIVLVMYHDVVQVEGHDGHDQQVAHALQQLLLLRPQGNLSQLCQENVLRYRKEHSSAWNDLLICGKIIIEQSVCLTVSLCLLSCSIWCQGNQLFWIKADEGH